jgi:HEAT repeat protein
MSWGLIAALSALAASPTVATTPDGAVDVADPSRGGAVVAHVKLETPPLRRGAPTARAVEVEGHRVFELRVPVRGTGRTEVWVGAAGAKGAGPRVLWSGLAGPRDADGETSVDVEVSEDGVFEFQTSAVVSRCDGAPARLFPRAFDFAQGRFRPISAELPPAAGETLTARRGDPAMPKGRPLAPFPFRAASTTLGAADARGLLAPTAIDDGDPATAWAEGQGDDGRGAWLTARAGASGVSIRGLRFVPGDAASAQSFKARNRVRRFQLAVGPRADQRFEVVVPEDPAADASKAREPYWVALPRPLVSSCATVVITEVTPGTEAKPPASLGTTAISELAIFTDVDGPDAAERLVADVARSADCATRVPALVGLGASALEPVARAITTPGARGATRECLVEALAALDADGKSPVAADAFVAALAGATAKEERLATAALRKRAEPPVGPLGGTLAADAAPLADRARVARVLGALDDERAVAPLLAAAGSGPPELRLAVVGALSTSARLRTEVLLGAIAAAGDANAARAADLLRVVPAAVRREPASADAALAALRAAVAPARPFEVRARATAALGGLGRAGAHDLVELAARGDEPVLRHLAARELPAVGGLSSVVALRGALSDGDPRVRETAAQGLAQLRDAGATETLVAGAKQEPWPFVRRAELDALGALCTPGAADLFVRAVERDVDEVRRAGLVGLARCKDPRARTTLLHALGRRTEAATLRELAAGLLGDMGDRTVAPTMAAALARQVSESEEDLAIEGVATATLRALAHLGGPEATAAAVKLSADKRHPFQRDAVEALGQLCDPGAGAAALRALESGKDATLGLAAQAASRRCATK